MGERTGRAATIGRASVRHRSIPSFFSRQTVGDG